MPITMLISKHDHLTVACIFQHEDDSGNFVDHKSAYVSYSDANYEEEEDVTSSLHPSIMNQIFLAGNIFKRNWNVCKTIMGISKAVGVVGFTFFFAAVWLKDSNIKLIPLLLLLDSFIACLISVASHPRINFPMIFGKCPNGKFPLWSKVLFFPFLLLVRVYVFFRRLKSKEPIYNEISEGLYVGGWPSSKKHLPPGEPAVIDCTCELPRSSVVSEDAYLCLAIWDTRAPQLTQIETAVLWASNMRAQKKPIYVHCAFGHGRSVCVMCAVLVTLGVTEDWKAAEKLVREKRPKIRMNALHRKHLEEWLKVRNTSTREHGNSVAAICTSFVQK